MAATDKVFSGSIPQIYETLLVPLIWGPLLQLNTFLSNYVVATFLITLTIVVSVVYLFMPMATRLFAPWLSSSTQPKEK